MSSRPAIEALQFNVEPTAEGVAALAEAGVLARVHRLRIEADFTAETTASFVANPDLATVGALSFHAAHDLVAFESFVNGEHWTGVRDFHFSCGRDDATAGLLAESRLLPGLVAVGCFSFPRTGVVPESGRLPLLRRIDESLSMVVFGDGRQARRWLAVEPATPLRAKLERFVAETYSTDDTRSVEEIIASLRHVLVDESLDFDGREERIAVESRALLAVAFDATPVPPGTNVSELTETQCEALAALAELEDHWFQTAKDSLASYGFDFYEERFREFLAGEITSE